MLTLLATIFTSSASGGLLGGIFGLFKQSQERKERVEMARIELDRDTREYANDQAERDHALVMLERGAAVEIERTRTEAEATIEVANSSARGAAVVEEFRSLGTSTGMDNFRASIRPGLAVWSTLLYSVMLVWAFSSFGDKISVSEGKTILMGLFATLSFTVTSVVTFYYVSRRNAAPKV